MAPTSPAFSFPTKQQRRAVFLFVGTLVTGYLVWLVLGNPEDKLSQLVGNLAVITTGSITTLLALWMRRQAKHPSQHNVKRLDIWSWFAAGLAIWTLADLMRLFLEVLSPTSLSTFVPLNLVLIDGSIAMLIGFITYQRQPREQAGKALVLIDATITSTALVTLTWLAIFQPAYQLLDNGQGNLAVILFPFADLLLLLALVNLFLLGKTSSVPSLWGWVGMALACYTLSDLAYAYLLINGPSQASRAITFGWLVGDFLMITAILNSGKVTLSPTRWTALSIQTRTRIQSLLPLATTIILCLYSITAWQFNHQINQLSLWVSVVLGLGLITRQGILTGEYEFQQYASLVNSVAEPTFVCDSQGLLRLVNPALLATTGYDHPDRLRNLPIQFLMLLPENTPQLLHTAMENGWSGEVQMRRLDGSLIPVSLALRPVLPGGDRSLALAGTAHDLSEQKQQQAALQFAFDQAARAQAQLEQLNTQLEEKVAEKTASLSEAYAQLEKQNRELQNLDRIKSDFVSLVSHELRAPLTNINGGIELVLAQAKPLPPRVNSTLNLVQAEIQRLTRFVETILDLSALDAGRTPIYPAPMHLDTIVTRLQNQMMHLPGANRVRWQMPPNLPYLMADDQALTSVLFHLLDNALKYAPTGEIVVSAGVQTNRAWVQVADEGPGIPEEIVPYIFSRFYRSNASDSQTVYGHGLGLYIVRRLMQAMQGDVQVTNRPESGACFTCWLPVLTSNEMVEIENTIS